MPAKAYDEGIKGKYDLRLTETFMGFHCGNTCSSLLKQPTMSYQRIMKRGLEPDLAEPDITRGTMEGDLKAGDITFYRLQSGADTTLHAYIAQGAVLDVPTNSFGSIGVSVSPRWIASTAMSSLRSAIPTMALWPSATTASPCLRSSSIWGVTDIAYNQPKHLPYPTENPFA